MTKTITNEDIFGLLQDFMQMTSDRFDRLEERMDRLEERMDRLEERMDRLEERMDRLEERMNSLEERMARIENRMDRLEEKMDGLEATSVGHTVSIQTLTEKVESLVLHTSGLDDDVKYLYQLIDKFKKEYKANLISKEEIGTRLAELEAIAKRLSQKIA